jgi:hypothetical protein
MNDADVFLWGLLPEAAGIADPTGEWADILGPDPADDGPGYPYVRSTGESGGNEHGRAATLAELRALAGESVTCQIGDVADRSPVGYRDLAVTVTVFGPEESYALAPAWCLWTERNRFRPESGGAELTAERADQLVELARRAHARTGSVLTYGDVLVDPYDPDVHPTRERVIARELGELYWLNVFDPRFVDAIGREDLLALDAYECGELSDGSVSLRVSERPTERDVPERRRLLGALR